MPITRKRYFPHTVTIDDQPVRLRLKRMTVPEFEEFRAMLVSLGQSRGAPASMAVLLADAAAKEAAKDTEAVVEPALPVTLDDLKVEADYLRANAEWQQEVFEAYVSIVPGDVVDEDDEGNRVEVTSGRMFAEMFHGQGVIAKILAELYLANTLTDEQKKTLRSRSGSATGSSADAKTATPGARPEPTAASVEVADSADLAGAMAPPSDTSSGTTDRSSSESALCGH